MAGFVFSMFGYLV